MTRAALVWIIIILIAIIGGWYWWSQQMPSSQTAMPAQNAAATASSTPTIADIGDNLTLGTDSTAALGQFLIAYNGMTLYSYAKDTPNTSNCNGDCATTWPPYVVQPDTQLNAESPIAGTLGTTTRADGTTQVTYNGMPLYFYSGDGQSGDTTGQGIDGVWSVVKP